MNAGYTSHRIYVTPTSKVFDGAARGFEHARLASFSTRSSRNLENFFRISAPPAPLVAPRGNCANFLMRMLSKANLVALGNWWLPNCYFFESLETPICLTCNINFLEKLLLLLSSHFVKISIFIPNINLVAYKSEKWESEKLMWLAL